MRKRLVFSCVLATSLVACGGGSSPNNPSSPPQPQYPNVAGSYSGTTTIVLPELGASARVSCPTTTTVTQSGANVNIAPLVLRGDCGSLSVPMGAQTIDTTGSLGAASNFTYDDPSCGGRYTASASGGFFGRELRIAINAVSSVCYNLNMTINLTR